ncbi:Xaa-Pro peptidase family protein [Mesorhizobium sp. M0615]|uniref:M24 family metallopeptidase n=1 Tax=Mesorhizobium sp. M0615 TaxID=2956971 RepID=UPI003336F71D
MSHHSSIPFVSLPFPKSEYARRQQKMFEEMERVGLDAILVTAHGHLQYFTGYNGQGGYYRPFPLILIPGRPPTYVVREYEVDAVRSESCIDDITTYTYQDDFAKVCADVLRRYEVQSRKVGLQLNSWNLAPADVSAIQALLPELKVTDATSIISSVASVMGDLEIQAMRDAMTMTDLAVKTFQQSLRNGVSEVDVLNKIQKKVRASGGEISTDVYIVFGERVKLPHGHPTRHQIRNNQPAFMEVGGSKQGYAAGLLRCAVLGRHPETESLHQLSEEVLEAAIAAIKPGVVTGEVHAAACKVMGRSGRRDAFRQRTGYGTGINWSERGYLSFEPGTEYLLKAGMTFHMPIILRGESGYLFGAGEQILVTEGGAEILSTTSRRLYFA